MARRPAKSVAAAEKNALAGDNESQDSLEAFEQHRLNHAVGMLSSSPVSSSPVLKSLSPKKTDAVMSGVGVKKTNISQFVKSLEETRTSTKPQNASDALPQPNATNNFSTESSQRLNSSPTPSNPELSEPASVPVQLVLYDVASPVERPSQLSGDDGATLPPSSALKKKTGDMSSDSPTQSNDGRSYEQYANDNSQRLQSSSQASHAPEHSTLQEDDTGFLNFKGNPYDIPGSVQQDVELNFAYDVARESQPTTQAPGASSRYAIAPETPAIGRGLFRGGNGAVLPPSQLFGQTQYTSALKKASPTSSRPSPDVFNQNTISPNPLASSPLKHRGLRTSPTNAFTSSPAPFDASSRPLDDKTPSAPANSRDDDHVENVVDTPVPLSDIPRRKTVLEPISEYRSWRKQSPEINASKSSSHGDEEQDSDSEVDTATYRRRLAKLRQERASKAFPSISLPRPNSSKGDNVEVPSTNRPKPIQNRRRTDADHYLAQCHGKTATDNDASQETVADSQEAQAPPQHTEPHPKASDESTDQNLDADEDQAPDLPKPRAPAFNMDYRETIPETSPVSTSIEPPRLIGDIMREQSSARSGLDTVSFPTLSSVAEFEQQPKGSSEARHSSLPEQLSSIPTNRKHEPSRSRAGPSPTPSIVLASSPQSVIRRSARLGNITTPLSTRQDISILSQPGSRTSTLTSLSATPSMTSSITPSTEPDRVPETTRRKSSSPAVTKPQRRGKPPPSSEPPSLLPKIKALPHSRESTRRLTRHNSMSTDELAGSPLSMSGKDELRHPVRKLGRQSLTSQHLLRESTLKRGIFDGMVFALSFQSGQVRKNKDKVTDRSTIEHMIRQGGGRVLADGFDELFSFDSFQARGNATASHTLSSSLTLFDDGTGFTALIADGHSRKVKYMQALALGIPCLAPKWITTCTAKKEIVDWTSYLLCAGPSALLGEAIRSRDLQPFDACTAKLVDIINNRPKLLDEARILLVMKTRNEGKKLPYVFLAQVLGGSLVRVHSLEEARTKLREGESQDQPFDWVYVDGNMHDAQRALFNPAAGETASKKRKRQSVSSETSDRPPKKIRTLDDELVIQSLILGRLIEDGEMEE
ncbi:hypothetical protein F4818DRAFT_414150 [Hypoxylon cercidicola]|nr:hypothetical protein F4818DRAFT_414150 [Hypoxylon cercidicola]